MKHLLLTFAAILIIMNAHSITLNSDSILIDSYSSQILKIGFKPGVNDVDTTFAFSIIGSNISYDTITKKFTIIGNAILISEIGTSHDTIAHIHQDTTLFLNELIDSGWTCNDTVFKGDTIQFNGSDMIVERIKLYSNNTDSTRTDSSGYATNGQLLFEKIGWRYRLDTLTYYYKSKYQSNIIPDIHYVLNDTLSVANTSLILLNTTFDYNYNQNIFTMYGDSLLFIYSQDTLIVGFGTNAKPGLELKHNKIQRFEFEIHDSVKMFGLQLIADSLVFEFDGDSSQFSVFCDSLIIAYGHSDSTDTVSSKQLDANLGDAQDPGLLIKHGQLEHLRFGISDSLTYKGLHMDFNNINFEYDVPNHYYKFFGGPIDLNFKGDTMSVDFGGVEDPGLLIQNGEMKEFNVALTGKGKILGFDFNSDSLSLLWIEDSSRFEISTGDISLYMDTTSTNKDSLNIEFTPPGLVIEHGAVSEFNATISDQFTLSTLDFKTNSLSIDYDKAQDLIIIYGGDLSILFGPDSLKDSLMVQCGDLSDPGISLKDGHIEEVDIDINTIIKMKSFEFKAVNLKLLYVDSTDIFSISGDTIIMRIKSDSIQGENIDMEFRNGDLDKFSMGISKDFKLKTLELKPIGLTFEYDAVNHQFELYDSLIVKIGSDEIHSFLGTNTQPGIVLKNEEITEINIDINGLLSIGGLEFKIKDAGIQWPMQTEHISHSYDSNYKLQTSSYTSHHDTVALFGDFTINKLWDANVKIGTSSQPGIEITKNGQGHSEYKIDNLSLKLEEVKLETMTIEEMLVRYSQNSIEVGATIIVKNAFEADGDITLSKNSGGHYKIDSVQIGFEILPSKEGIVLGETDMFLQGASIGYDFDHKTFKGGFMLSDGVEYKHGSDKGFMMFINGDALVSRDRFYGKLDMDIGAYRKNDKWHSDISKDEFKVDLNWHKKVYKLSGDIKIPTDYGVKVDGDIVLKENVKVFYGDVDVRIPKNWSIIGGKHLGDIGGALMMYKHHTSRSFVAGWTDIDYYISTLHIGIEYKFKSKKFHKLNYHKIKHIKKIVKKNIKGISSNISVYEVEINDDSFGDVLISKIKLSNPISSDKVEISILGPNEIYTPKINIYDSVSQQFIYWNPYTMPPIISDEYYIMISESMNSPILFNQFSNSSISEPKVVELQRGVYELIIHILDSTTCELETAINHSNGLIHLDVSQNLSDNSVEIKTFSWVPQVGIEPVYDSVSNTISTITHKTGGPYAANASQITIFVDNDSLGYNGRMINNIHQLTVSNANGVQTHQTDWNPYGYKPGEKYYFYAVLRDSIDIPRFSNYSVGITADPKITGQIVNIDTAYKGVGRVLVFLDLNQNGKLDLNRVIDFNDSISANDSIPFKIQGAEPNCYTDTLGNFYFDAHRNSKTLLDTGFYQLEFYLPKEYKVDTSSNFKRGDLIHYQGTPYNVDIRIKEED